MINKILFTLVALMLTSCDVPGIIHIVNKSPGTAYYIFEMTDGDIVRTDTIELSNVRKKNETNIMFGFGHWWMDESIKAYTAKIEKIEIVSLTDTIRLTDKNEMFKFFMHRRMGVFSNKIHIAIK